MLNQDNSSIKHSMLVTENTCRSLCGPKGLHLTVVSEECMPSYTVDVVGRGLQGKQARIK